MNQSDTNILLELERKFKARDNNEYNIKSIVDSKMYGKEIKNQLLDLYYLVL